ncbi:hypothetical protein IMZ48_36115 [Candidatus Bathyarchaeota archaeon]|nr:hypothetical protein [Candidatus Bathyarchaeota archaeon]
MAPRNPPAKDSPSPPQRRVIRVVIPLAQRNRHAPGVRAVPSSHLPPAMGRLPAKPARRPKAPPALLSRCPMAHEPVPFPNASSQPAPLPRQFLNKFRCTKLETGDHMTPPAAPLGPPDPATFEKHREIFQGRESPKDARRECPRG